MGQLGPDGSRSRSACWALWPWFIANLCEHPGPVVKQLAELVPLAGGVSAGRRNRRDDLNNPRSNRSGLLFEAQLAGGTGRKDQLNGTVALRR